MRLSANTGFLYTDLPFLDRIAAAAADGFDAVEFHDEWRHERRDDVAAALRDAGLPLVGLNARMDDTAGAAALPDRDRARADVDEALDAARDLGAGGVHVLAGKTEMTADARAAYLDTLAHATRGEGPAILIEPLCRRAMPVYPLRRVAEAADLIAAVGSPRLRIMFDVYHVHQEGDPVAATFAAHAAHVGHVQIADPDTRAEPQGIGPLRADLAAAGWSGPVGCEYRPATSTRAGLGWRREMSGT